MKKPFGLANFPDFPSVQPLDPPHPTEVVAPTAAMNRALRALSQRAVEELEMPPVRCPSSRKVETEIGGESVYCIVLHYLHYVYLQYLLYIFFLFIYLFIYAFICLCICLYVCMCMYIYIIIC